MIRTPPGEPVVHGWTIRPTADVARELVELAASRRDGACRVVAVDGRSGGGKSTFAAELSACSESAVVVHSDDVAWWESFFDWEQLMVEGILEPALRGEGVRYRPPAWDRRGREGAIAVPAGTSLLVMEGVGVSRRSMMPWVGASVWVQSDFAEARRRGVERDGGTPEAEAFWDEWNAAEVAFLDDDRPWERADIVVCGTPDLADVRAMSPTEVVVGRAPTR